MQDNHDINILEYSGYLDKRGENFLKTYKKRFFRIEDNGSKIYYYENSN
jgi:hypothetical protein